MSLLRDMKLINWSFIMLRDIIWMFATKSSQPTTSSAIMWHHKPDLLLFRSIPGTGNLLSKHALGIL